METEMMKINGMVKVGEMEFHEIEGGFGSGKKSILAKEIAIIHGKKLGKINELINNNRKRFKNGIDIIDLKNSEFAILLKDSEIYTQNSLNASTNIYLLSERGYSKLLKIMDDDLAWEKYDELVDNYFKMRQEIKQISERDKLLLGLFSKDEMIVAQSHKALLELETKPLKEKIEEDKPYVRLAKERISKDGKISITDITKTFDFKKGQLGAYLKNNGYLHKTRTEVNDKGKDLFSVYMAGDYKCIGILEKGLEFIKEHEEEIRQSGCRVIK